MAAPLQLAQQIDGLLRRKLGQGIDLDRMLSSPLYARDVLLVCDALRDGEAPVLARAFRAAAATQAERHARAAFDWPDEPAVAGEGFGATLPPPAPLAEDAFDFPDSQPPEDEKAAERDRRWFSPSRWLLGR